MNIAARSRPGRTPATSNPATDTLASVAMMMTRTLGGITGARLAPPRIIPIESRRS
jgi:hypothetical protein